MYQQTVPNFLIMSLAMADGTVGLFVLPIALVNEITEKWFLGMCCTSSL